MCVCVQTDLGPKRSEFILWALEVKKVEVENLDRRDEMDLFRDYMEDYNTGGGGETGGGAHRGP